MNRIKFRKGPQGDDPLNEGPQRKFLKRVLEELNCPSLRALNQFGFDIPYSTLKNYFSEERLIPEDFFKDLCYLAKINLRELKVKILEENWGQVLGGKSSGARFK